MSEVVVKNSVFYNFPFPAHKRAVWPGSRLYYEQRGVLNVVCESFQSGVLNYLQFELIVS